MVNQFPSKEKVTELRKEFPAGAQIRFLIWMTSKPFQQELSAK